MKKLQLALTDREKLVHYFQKITQILSHLYAYINITPSIVDINNIIDYAHNTHLMLQDFYQIFQKKFVSVQVFNKMETELNQKNQKITQLINSQKNLKIQLKVMEDKLNESQSTHQNTFKSYNQHKQSSPYERLNRRLQQKSKQKQPSTQQVQKSSRIQLQIRKKRTSLPHLGSSSANLPSTNMIKLPKKKQSLFVGVPGEGNEALIQHLMRKISIK